MRPKEVDEVNVNIKAYYKDGAILFDKENWDTNMSDEKITTSMRKIIESMKPNEKCTVLVKASFIKENDKDLIDLIKDFDENKDLTIEIDLLRFT